METAIVMLEYRDNIDYNDRSNESVDELLADLLDALALDADANTIYDAIHYHIMKEIKINELAITTIMPDLINLMKSNERKALLVMHLLADPYASYSELGKAMGISKQRTAVILSELAKRYQWLQRFLALHNASKDSGGI